MLVKKIFYKAYLDTPLGSLFALADERGLYVLEFIDRPGLDHRVERLVSDKQAIVKEGEPKPVRSLSSELEHYFNGTLMEFKIAICLQGTPFQQRVWQEVKNIPPGTTKSYTNIASTIGKPTACRAVAQALSANKLFIVIPCHRVINSNGVVGGYGGGVPRKEWLIKHERAKRIR